MRYLDPSSPAYAIAPHELWLQKATQCLLLNASLARDDFICHFDCNGEISATLGMTIKKWIRSLHFGRDDNKKLSFVFRYSKRMQISLHSLLTTAYAADIVLLAILVLILLIVLILIVLIVPIFLFVLIRIVLIALVILIVIVLCHVCHLLNRVSAYFAHNKHQLLRRKGTKGRKAYFTIGKRMRAIFRLFAPPPLRITVDIVL